MSEQRQRDLLRKLKTESIKGMDEENTLKRIGLLVDLSLDFSDSEGTTAALRHCDKMEGAVSGLNAPYLDYIFSNAWANRFIEAGLKHSWSWTQPEAQKQIYYLKRAVNRPGFEKMDKVRRCQILTNLANQYSSLGRFVEAQEFWNKAIDIIPNFGMAIGNSGSGLISYLHALYDGGHQAVFAGFAFKNIKTALGKSAEYFDMGHAAVKAAYLEKLDFLGEIVDADFEEKISPERLSKFSLGRSKGEREYRRWCLNNRLFLNPLNDICKFEIAAKDVLTQPNIVAKPSVKPPAIIGFFNQMKQEYVSARWLYYQGIESSSRTHFSDLKVSLYNTLDYQSHALAVEQVKAAYRAAYSIFDKMAYFLNQYFSLGFEDKKVSFRAIWLTPKKTTLREELAELENWPLRGLYWLSKDFFDPDSDASDPEAKAIYNIRNHLEHKFLKIHEWGASEMEADNAGEGLGYSIDRSDFEGKTLHLMKLCRAAMIYLSLAVAEEERRRAPEGLVMPVFLTPLDDQWKA